MGCSSKLFDPSCLLISIFITIAPLLLSPFSQSDIIQKRKVEKKKWSKVRKFSRVVSYFTNCLIRFGIRELGVRNTNLGVCRIKDSVEALHCFRKKARKLMSDQIRNYSFQESQNKRRKQREIRMGESKEPLSPPLGPPHPHANIQGGVSGINIYSRSPEVI